MGSTHKRFISAGSRPNHPISLRKRPRWRTGRLRSHSPFGQPRALRQALKGVSVRLRLPCLTPTEFTVRYQLSPARGVGLDQPDCCQHVGPSQQRTGGLFWASEAEAILALASSGGS